MRKLGALFYRLLHLIALALLIYAFAQALPFDLLAVTVAGDMLTYLEIATVVWLAAQVTRVQWVAAYARFVLHRMARRARIRARRTVRRIRSFHPSTGDDGRPRPALA